MQDLWENKNELEEEEDKKARFRQKPIEKQAINKEEQVIIISQLDKNIKKTWRKLNKNRFYGQVNISSTA